MIREHICPICNREGKLWLPQNAENTIVKCPYCNEQYDVSYLINDDYINLEEFEREEYERLKRKYGY